MILYMYTAPGQGTTSCGRNFDVNRNILSLQSFVACFKQISLKSDFKHFFMILYLYIAPGLKYNPQGIGFWCQQKCLVTSFICCKFQKMSLKSDFILFFSPGAGGIQPPLDKVLMSTGTSCHFAHLLLVSNHRQQ